MRTPRRGDDGGFAMVFVLMVTAMVTVAVAAVLTVTTPDISRTKLDQDGQGAGAAAQAAVDDFIAYLLGIDRCRSTTRVCDEALGASSGVKTLDAANNSTMSWTSDASLTSDELVRVHATGTYGRATRTLDADLRLAPSILSYGYYSDYESQSSTSINDLYRARTVRLDRSGAWGNVTVARLSQATTASWATPTNTANCERHWWADNSTSPATPARGTSTWSSKYSFDTVSTSNYYAGGCDVIFATGMTFDGPVYTRDALLVDGSGGQGPIFQQPVLTGWGFTGHNSPAVPDPLTATNGAWRQQGTNATLTASPNHPLPARFDLTLPDTIGTDGVSANACVYTGPTRVVLNGDGTATVTSPLTRSKAAGADSACYPPALDTAGVVRWTIAYGTAAKVGGGTVLVKDIGTEPTAGWATTGQTSNSTPAASTSTFWTTASGGTASNGTSTAPDGGCTTSVTWSATANAACAWSEVPSYTATNDGWTSASTGACSTSLAATDQRRFECEYSNQTSGTPARTYATFRTAVKSALAADTTCAVSGISAAARQTCLANLVLGQLPPATASVRYQVTPSTGTAGSGSSRALTAGAPGFPQASDPVFANGPTTTGTETSTLAPVTLAVTRQTYSGGAWGGTTNQFKLTVTSTTWAVATASTATSYFPSVRDVTQYASSANPTQAAGDLYVEGVNRGRLSLLADNDVVVTGDVRDASTDITADAVNMVAGDFMRNYHPVACVDTTAASIAATTPGYCPNDITGLTTNTLASNGQFTADHPSQQYTNLTAAATRTIDAAMFALNGSLSSDNYNRGTYMGQLQINGGIYQEHRGVNGSQIGSGSTVARTGYLLQYHYVDQRLSNLPYEPTTKVKSGRVWSVASVSGSGAS